ncbi:MAG: rRNA pseudouridine synthase [Verrucomicrobia bacterium]|nr:rRNA pseudouridine synthase [Verrucomicrobiota bacterium]
MRLQKLVADAGVASRRASERLIVAGRIAVNGTPVRQLGTQVDSEQDRVTCDGVPLRSRRKRYLAVHKPRGYLCACRDARQRSLVADLLPAEWRGLYPVGRLDYESEGLLFVTNDGEFCLRLTHPRYGVRKRYLAEVQGRVAPESLRLLLRGVSLDGELLRAADARLRSANHSRSEIELVLTEGRNREVRRLLASQGLKVTRLRRTQIGPIKLGELPVGKWRTLTEPEINSLLHQL